jgi:tetratricopeptide (TPR) repeat protein
MASEAIAWIASALRCAAVRGGNDAISESTAKRVAGASAYVSAEKTTALLNNLLDALFTEAYLRGHGLEGQEAADHRALLVAGIEGALVVWDRFAAIGNACDREERVLVMLTLGVGLLTDLSARIAAYLVRFGRVVPALRRLLDPQPALTFAEALRRIRARARRTISDAELLRASQRGKSKVDRNTLRDLTRGKRLPREETILLLAHGLASLGIPEANGRDATATDLELELRFATLLSDLGEALGADRDLRDAVAGQRGALQFYASDLRRYPPTDLAEIVVRGTLWPRWSEVHARFSKGIENELVQMVRGVEADAERQARELHARSQSDPAAAHEMMAAHYRSLAAMTRNEGGQVPGGERSTGGDLVRFFEQAAELFAALATGREPPKYEGLGDTFRAKCLCDHALAPWNEFTPAQQRALYEQAVELDPACAYVRLRYAEFLLRQGGGIAEAERHLDDAVMLDEAYDDARLLLAEVLLQRDNPQAAIAHIDTLEARLGATAMVLTLRGFARLAFREVAAAADAFSRALDVAPRDVAAHLGMARAQRALGDASRARKHEKFAELFAGERSPRPTSVS